MTAASNKPTDEDYGARWLTAATLSAQYADIARQAHEQGLDEIEKTYIQKFRESAKTAVDIQQHHHAEIQGAMAKVQNPRNFMRDIAKAAAHNDNIAIEALSRYRNQLEPIDRLMLYYEMSGEGAKREAKQTSLKDDVAKKMSNYPDLPFGLSAFFIAADPDFIKIAYPAEVAIKKLEPEKEFYFQQAEFFEHPHPVPNSAYNPGIVRPQDGVIEPSEKLKHIKTAYVDAGGSGAFPAEAAPKQVIAAVLPPETGKSQTQKMS